MNIKRIISTFLAIIFVYTIANLSRTIWKLNQAQDQIVQEQDIVKELSHTELQLRDKLELSQQSVSQERVIRDKLLLSKPGETIVLLPEDYYLVSGVEPLPPVRVYYFTPIWKQWLEKFI